MTKASMKANAATNPHGLTVGQELWFVPGHRGGHSHYVTVQKIGRKWAEVGKRLRIDLETLIADGGDFMSPGTCYLSKEEHEQAVERSARWTRIQRFVRDQYGRPEWADDACLSILEGALRIAPDTEVGKGGEL